MQNQWKILIQLRDYLNKSSYDKNFHFIVNKNWIDVFQKLTYAQIKSIKKLASGVSSTSINSNVTQCQSINSKKEDDNGIQKSVPDTPKGTQIEMVTGQEVKQNLPAPAKINSKPVFREQIYSLPQILANLIPKLNLKNKGNVTIQRPRWKLNIHNNILKHGIISRTRHILNSITTAESNASKSRRIEDLLLHIEQYPEARHHAIKEGAIRSLLKIRQKTKNDQIKGSVREALAILGHIDPLPAQGIRILSIDGGGVRGVLVVEMLKKLEELTGKRIYELFDYICGVSTGAILSAVLGGYKNRTLDDISMVYKELSTKIFTQSALRGTSNLVWSHAYYDTALWEQLLQEHLGDKDLIKTAREPNAPKISAISTVVNHERVMPYIFRNYTLPYRVQSQYVGSYKHKVWEAVRASAAAPSYFEEFKLGENLHQDGGIMVNNPCAVAIHEAKQLWPNSPIQCVISFGTGRTPYNVNPCDGETSEVAALSSWKEKFYKILDSATDTEAVHTMLNDLLPDQVYYRFNPYLTEMLTMVEIRPDKITQLEQDAVMYIRKNEEKFQQAAKILLEERNVAQKIIDWIILKRQVLGL